MAQPFWPLPSPWQDYFIVPFSCKTETLQAIFLYPPVHFLPGVRAGGMCISSAIMDVNGIFTHGLPVAAISLRASFNVHKMREAEQLDLCG